MMLKTLRALLTQNAERLVRKEVTALRRLAKKHRPNSDARELMREIEKFYADFEADEEHIRASRQSLIPVFARANAADFEALLASWETTRVAAIVRAALPFREETEDALARKRERAGSQ